MKWSSSQYRMKATKQPHTKQQCKFVCVCLCEENYGLRSKNKKKKEENLHNKLL